MRKAMILSALMATSVSLPAMAYDEYYDRARVLSVTPQIERVNYPVESCHTEYVRESYTTQDRSPVGAIIGGVAGGLLGSQIGKGNGRVAGAAVGAGVGAVVGDRMGSQQLRTTHGTRPVERCVVTDQWRNETRGYLVNYHYNGRDYTAVMDHDPGPTMPVRVAVSADSHISNIRYHQHGYNVPTYVPGHPVAGYRPSPVYNIQYHYRDDRRDLRHGPAKHSKHAKHDRRDRRYY